MKKTLKLPTVTFHQNNRLEIIDYFENVPREKLEIGKGYVYDDCVWKYTDKPLVFAQKYPAISFNERGEIVTQTDANGKILTIETVLTDRLDMIVNQTTEDMDFRKENDVTPHASSTAVYIPEIKESDDFLKKLIKTVFLIKKVATTKYRKKLSKAYAFSNLFQGLNNETKISTTVWQTWIEIIGIDAVIILKDSGSDDEDPIDKYIVYKSRNDSTTIVDKEDIVSYLSKECL